MVHLYKLKYMYKWFVESEPVCTVSAYNILHLPIHNKQFSLRKLLWKIKIQVMFFSDLIHWGTFYIYFFEVVGALPVFPFSFPKW